jgi:2,4-dienoyl-CoA reductase-like NADH-dependent reductase (Old Yellow Enzyme family)
MVDFPKLFEPLDLGPVILRNRLTMTTHTREIGARRYERYLDSRARGGAASISVFASSGLINCATTPGRFIAAYGDESDALLPLSDEEARQYLDDREVPRLAGIAHVVQPHGAAVFGQLHHAGADRVAPMERSSADRGHFHSRSSHQTVGDCRSPRRMIFAIQEGARGRADMSSRLAGTGAAAPQRG